MFGSNFFPTRLSAVLLSSVQLATRSFSRGTNSPHGDLPDETRYSQFRLTVAGIERQRPRSFCSLPPIDFTSLLDLLTSREYRLISRFKLNFFCFVVSFMQNEIKWLSNRLVIVKPFPKHHFNKKCIFQSVRENNFFCGLLKISLNIVIILEIMLEIDKVIKYKCERETCTLYIF